MTQLQMSYEVLVFFLALNQIRPMTETRLKYFEFLLRNLRMF